MATILPESGCISAGKLYFKEAANYNNCCSCARYYKVKALFIGKQEYILFDGKYRRVEN